MPVKDAAYRWFAVLKAHMSRAKSTLCSMSVEEEPQDYEARDTYNANKDIKELATCILQSIRSVHCAPPLPTFVQNED